MVIIIGFRRSHLAAGKIPYGVKVVEAPKCETVTYIHDHIEPSGENLDEG